MKTPILDGPQRARARAGWKAISYQVALRRFFVAPLLIAAAFIGTCRLECAFAETPSGFVGLEKDEAGIWWFKSPEGVRFLSIGINHVEMEYWRSPNNREFVLETYGPDLFDRSGALRDGSPAADKWGRRAGAFLAGHGFNTLGVHNPASKSLRSGGLPYYIVELKNPVNWGWNFSRTALLNAFKRRPLDVFDASFSAEVHSEAEKLVKPVSNDPRVLGYVYTDGPPWTVNDDRDSPAFRNLSSAERIIHPWALALMSLPAEAAGKRAWLAMMKERYASPAEAGETYARDTPTWDALAATTAWTAVADTVKVAGDSQAFLERIMRQWYSVRKAAVRKHDPHRLIFGDKLNMNRDIRHPEHLVGSLRVMKDYVDVINVQYYGLFEEQREGLSLIHKETGKPVLNGDTTFNPRWKDPSADDSAYRQRLGQTFHDELPKLFSLPWFIGWHHCGYMRGLRKPYRAALERGDRAAAATFEKAKHTYRPGFITEFEVPIAAIIDPLSRAIAKAEAVHSGANGQVRSADCQRCTGCRAEN